MKKILYILAVISFSLTIFSCATPDALAQIGLISERTASDLNKSISASAKVKEEFTPEEEYYVGRSVASSILLSYKLKRNSQTEAYLNSIAQTLINNFGADEVYNGYHVAILDSNEINAFATPAGHILVTKGLIKAAGSEDALAAVIAHELSHIQLGHPLQSIQVYRQKEAAAANIKAGGKTILTAIDKIKNLRGEESNLVAETEKFEKTIETNFNQYVDLLSNYLNELINKGYSQTTEFEADSFALNFLEASGYNVYAMNDVLLKIKAVEDTQTEKKGILKTHPSADMRIKNLDKRYKNFRAYPTDEARTKRYLNYTSHL